MFVFMLTRLLCLCLYDQVVVFVFMLSILLYLCLC